MEKTNVLTATIANGASLSGAVPLGNGGLTRIAMPAAWTAANLTFQTSYDGVTFANLYNHEGTEYTVQAAASREILLPLADFLGVRFIKIRSGTSAAAVAQGAERSLKLVVQP